MAMPYVDGVQMPNGLPPGDAAEQVQVQVKYEGYIARQQDEITRAQSHDLQPIPGDIDYSEIRSLSFEVRQKLMQYRPETIGQASRMSGVTPAAISLLLIHLKRIKYGSQIADNAA
jgi:tRNA uridine 5-carboxymethylaminomethyl modification enzyme